MSSLPPDKRASGTTTDSSSSTSSGGIDTTKRSDRSAFMKLLQATTKPIMPRMPGPKKDYPPGSPQLNPHKAATKTRDVHERKVEDIYIYDLLPKRDASTGDATAGETKFKRHVYYVAGGSWRVPPSKQHWGFCAELVKQCLDTRVSVISHPLAPNSPAPEALPQMLKMYRRLLKDATALGEKVILMGDSSGGNIVLCLAAHGIAEDYEAPAPAAIVAICPSVNLRQDNPEQREVEQNDPILRIASSKEHVDMWRGPWDASDPRVNPLEIDWGPVARKGTRIDGVVGGYDILRPDAVKLKDKLNESGVRGDWLDWDKQMHGFPLTFMYGLAEGKKAKDWIVDAVSKT